LAVFNLHPRHVGLVVANFCNLMRIELYFETMRGNTGLIETAVWTVLAGLRHLETICVKHMSLPFDISLPDSMLLLENGGAASVPDVLASSGSLRAMVIPGLSFESAGVLLGFARLQHLQVLSTSLVNLDGRAPLLSHLIQRAFMSVQRLA
ncbi:hypothetical protein EV182_005948, partial [Spiromyces aspiralis]